ncbi:MAG: bacillithiol biosynthesis deacetylase BshB1 [Planctomycetota bacterium]|nr:MAG: bacillithiol biosynthesis deacetylase BshB1 [Planctomycetota bacterium]
MDLDVLAFGAHPDDVELACGGTVIKLARQGYRTGVVDLTKGEMGTRGTPEDREQEAATSAEVMGLAVRKNLEIPDAHVTVSEEAKKKVVSAIREYRPRVVLCPYIENRHPDHSYTGQLVIDAAFLAGLGKLDTGHEPFRPEKVIFYMPHYKLSPTFIVDITEHFEDKMKAVGCYSSQFHNDKSKEPETYISSPEFMDMLVTKMKYFGTLIGKTYGEQFFLRDFMEIKDIMGLVPPREEAKGLLR